MSAEFLKGFFEQTFMVPGENGLIMENRISSATQFRSMENHQYRDRMIPISEQISRITVYKAIQAFQNCTKEITRDSSKYSGALPCNTGRAKYKLALKCQAKISLKSFHEYLWFLAKKP